LLTDEIRYKLLKLLEENPAISQRELARELGVSLGRVNYCVKALIERGLVKASNFRRSTDKRRYAYLLTPQGLEEKASVTLKFLRRKVQEHEALSAQIEELRREATMLRRQRANQGRGRE
jgi:EPS-associated MarR family transcriptional regulator